MSLKALTKLALGAAIGSIGFMVTNAPAQASLLGDTVRVQFDTTNPVINLDNMVTVMDGFESTNTLGDIFALDMESDGFHIKYTGGASSFITGNTKWTLSDLDWVNDPTGFIKDVTLVSGDASLIDSIMFDGHSIMVDIADANLSEGAMKLWSFAIKADHPRVPEPATTLGLLTVAGLGLGSRLKRNIG